MCTNLLNAMTNYMETEFFPFLSRELNADVDVETLVSSWQKFVVRDKTPLPKKKTLPRKLSDTNISNLKKKMLATAKLDSFYLETRDYYDTMKKLIKIDPDYKETYDYYNKMKMNELKGVARDRHVKTFGLKIDLILRIMGDSITTPLREKAGLTFPVGRVRRNLRKGNYAKRIDTDSAVYLAGVMEYLVADALELAGNETRQDGNDVIAPVHLQRAFNNDSEFKYLLEELIPEKEYVWPKNSQIYELG